MRVHIRPAQPGDLPTIQDIAKRTVDKCYRSFLGNEAIDWYINSSECDREVQRHMDHCIVAIDAAGIAGFSMFFGATLHWILVDVRHHRTGIGSQLLSYTEEQLFSKGNAVARLEMIESNTTAEAFYLKNGWKIVGKQKDKTYDFMRFVLEKTCAH